MALKHCLLWPWFYRLQLFDLDCVWVQIWYYIWWKCQVGVLGWMYVVWVVDLWEVQQITPVRGATHLCQIYCDPQRSSSVAPVQSEMLCYCSSGGYDSSKSTIPVPGGLSNWALRPPQLDDHMCESKLCINHKKGETTGMIPNFALFRTFKYVYIYDTYCCV